MTEITRQFKRQSANRFSAVFSEIVAENEAPIIGDLWVQKWWIGNEQKILITITIPDKKKRSPMGMNKAVKVLEIDLNTVHETFFNGLFNKKYPFSISLKITPSMAHRILEHCNANNRPIPEARVMRITQQIKNNQWIINTNTIGFNVNGNLCDGQKRLTAILRANKAITTLVTFNLPVDSFKTVDTNQARNASDLAAMAGISDYGHVGTAINLLYRYQQGTLQRFGENPDNIIRDQLIKENLAIQDSIGAGRSVAKMMSKSVGVFCHYVLACIDREAANRFFEKLGTGAFLFPDDPIFLLRERLTRERMARTYFPAYEIVALIFKAWNACPTKRKPRRSGGAPRAASLILDPSKPEHRPAPRLGIGPGGSLGLYTGPDN